jgi:hypothetical protein
VTSDHARKKAIRDRMAVTGEPYAEASRNLGATGTDAASAVIAAATRTLDAPCCRIVLRQEEVKEPAAPRGPLWSAAAVAGRAIGSRVPRGLAESFSSNWSKEGFASPSTDQYMISWGNRSEAAVGGQLYLGHPGRLVAEIPFTMPVSFSRDHPLWLVALLHGATDASFECEEDVRGVRCRKYAVRPKLREDTRPPEELIAWLDARHARQVRVVAGGHTYKADIFGKVSYGRGLRTTTTLELRDFGMSADELDWSRFPPSPDVSSLPGDGILTADVRQHQRRDRHGRGIDQVGGLNLGRTGTEGKRADIVPGRDDVPRQARGAFPAGRSAGRTGIGRVVGRQADLAEWVRRGWPAGRAGARRGGW